VFYKTASVNIGAANHPVPLYQSDFDRQTEVLCFLSMSPASFDFLLSKLPKEDVFTKDLYDLREKMKNELWDRVA